jgi:hypothetical protein
LILERRVYEEQGIGQYADCPAINLKRISDFLQNVWCNIVGGSTQRPFFLPIKFELGSQAEVAHLGHEAVAEEDVAGLEVTVDDIVAVKVDEAQDHPVDEKSYLGRTKASPAPDQFAKGPIFA